MPATAHAMTYHTVVLWDAAMTHAVAAAPLPELAGQTDRLPNAFHAPARRVDAAGAPGSRSNTGGIIRPMVPCRRGGARGHHAAGATGVAQAMARADDRTNQVARTAIQLRPITAATR